MVGGERTTRASTASSLKLRRANARRPLTHSLTHRRIQIMQHRTTPVKQEGHNFRECDYICWVTDLAWHMPWPQLSICSECHFFSLRHTSLRVHCITSIAVPGNLAPGFNGITPHFWFSHHTLPGKGGLSCYTLLHASLLRLRLP